MPFDLFADHIPIQDFDSAVRLFNESRAGFMKLFNNSPVSMSMTTTTPGRRVYVRVNQKFLDRFGYTTEEIIGHTSSEFGILDEAESDRVRSIIIEKGRLHNDYVKCRTKGGEIVHTISSIERMDMNDETFLVSFFVDVTRIYEQQAVIEKHAAQLEAVNKELEAFSYSVSHDLRAPLRVINGYAKILEEDYGSSLGDEARKLLETVQVNAIRMSELIDSLLSFARLGKLEVTKVAVNMNDLVAEVLAELKRATNHRAEVCAGELHPAFGDPILLKQVMVNLISNAVKYSSKKESPRVEICSGLSGDTVIYSVRDNGAGFDMKFADRLFGVFQRLHRPTEFEGTGVGLATVKRIVTKLGGSIRAESEPGKGATFYVSLPAEVDPPGTFKAG